MFIRPDSVLNTRVYENAATFTHELVHNRTGLGDLTIQPAVGLEVGAPTKNISERLRADCVGTALAPK